MKTLQITIILVLIFATGYFLAYTGFSLLMNGYTEPKDYGTSSLEVKPNYGKQSDQFHRAQEAHNINQLTDETL